VPAAKMALLLDGLDWTGGSHPARAAGAVG